MFDITGDDIARLNDADLRTLVARLAIAELAAHTFPISAVTAGGHQDAKDGGIDVRVDLDVPLVAPDFVPRAKPAFRSKGQTCQRAASRNAPDNQLLHDAEVLSLLYSFDGENIWRVVPA